MISDCNPWRLYGREDGAKPDVLLRFRSGICVALWRIVAPPWRSFVRPRGLERLVCLLVSWGYLKPADLVDLPAMVCCLRHRFAGEALGAVALIR